MMDVISRLVAPEETADLKEFLLTSARTDRPYLLDNDIRLAFEKFAAERGRPPEYAVTSSLARFLRRLPELFSTDGRLWICHRHAIARYRFYRCLPDGGEFGEITVEEYLDAKDRFILGKSARLRRPPRIDFTPFHDFSPVMRDGKSIGGGIRFLNKHLSSSLFQKPKKWGEHLFGFISLHRIDGRPLLVNGDVIRDAAEFLERIDVCLDWLQGMSGATDHRDARERLRREGFEEGWGRDVARIRETMRLVRDLFAEPDADGLERFVSRIPMISRIAIISPHGWFGQKNVLGKPDTGGQVIYILDQVRALERRMTETFRLAGMESIPRILVLTRLIPEAGDTTCDRRKEKILGTANSWILRVPFRDPDQRVIPHWISRFEVWPYLDRFAEEAHHELLAEFPGRPDLIIGNYSDGNLVASLLSDRMDVIQCAIAHALEKTKYLFSDLYWERMEGEYHFPFNSRRTW